MDTQQVIGVVFGVGLGSIVAYFLIRGMYEILKDFVLWLTKPIRKRYEPGSEASAAKYGRPEVSVDQRVYDHAGDNVRKITALVEAWQPQPRHVRLPPLPTYHAVIPAMDHRLPPSILASDLSGDIMDAITRHGLFTVETRVGPNPEDKTEYVDDLALLMRPADPADAAMRTVLASPSEFHTPAPSGLKALTAPDFGPVPTAYPIPKPEIYFPNGKSRSLLSSNEMTAFAPWISRYDDAASAWEDAESAHRAELLNLRDALIRLQARMRAANEGQDKSYREAHTTWAAGKSSWEASRDLELRHLQSLLDDWNAAFLDEPERLAVLTLNYLKKPAWLPIGSEARFDRESGVLIVETQFPDIGRINWHRRGIVPMKAATKADAKAASEALYQALGLRYAWEVARSANDNLVDTVAVNGWADYIDRSTGETKRAFVSSVLAKVSTLRGLNLPMVDVHQAFKALKGMAGRAQTVTPVAPIVRMNIDDRRFVDAKAVLDDIGDQNLATMDWGNFEHLCRELFEKVFAGVGAQVKVTQASRDQGVDAVIFDPDPIRGGKIVIQAKRYSGTVDVSAVRDLWGTTQHEGAMKGILVTTSGFGPDAYNFIAGKPLTLINGGELLGILSQQGYNFRIDLAEAKKMAKDTYSTRTSS